MRLRRVLLGLLAIVASLAVLAVLAAERTGDDVRRGPAAAKDAPTRRGALAGPPAAWSSHEDVLARLEGRRIRLGGDTIPVNRDLVQCNGEGRPVPAGGTPRWSRFTCTLSSSRDEPDVTFDVDVLRPDRLLLHSARRGSR